MAKSSSILQAFLALAVLTVLPASSVFAADDPPVTEQTGDNESAETQAPAAEDDDIVVVQDTSSDSADDMADAEGDVDFIPSVQISEDLSVSFPVDI